VFANDLSDHCVIGCVRNTKIPKLKGLTVLRRYFKHFSEHGFLSDLARLNWDRVALIPTVDEAVAFFQEQFVLIANKHAPFKRHRIKNRDNPWFSHELAQLIQSKNKQWSLARRTNSNVDWQHFRRLRNQCTTAIRTSKSNYYLTATNGNFNNPSKFWKTIKVLQNKKASDFPQELKNWKCNYYR